MWYVNSFTSKLNQNINYKHKFCLHYNFPLRNKSLYDEADKILIQ